MLQGRKQSIARPEAVAAVGDSAGLSMPWKELYYYDLDSMIQSLHKLLRYDFKMVAPGHSVVGNKQDLRECYQYLVDLRVAVLKGMNQGLTLQQMQERIQLKKYRHFAKYNEWLNMNIKGAYQAMERALERFGQTK
ncbi:MAG: hypothetical protein EP343_09575 [Deltaproteobacteria bacterium]|nr:MAG: hypothetical protein EP343_09575 [Deltaproteobacteria bacterium]